MIKLELEINDVNTILASLSKQPFESVANIIVKIKQQGDAQSLAIMQAKAAEEALTAEDSAE